VWGAAQLKPRQAHIAIPNLARQGFLTFNPCYERKTLVRGRVEVVCSQLFTGYLLVAIEPDMRWAAINSTAGINRLLTRKSDTSEYHVPCFLDDNFVSGLKQCSHPDEDRNGHEVWVLQPGTVVRLVSGPLRGHTGTIVSWNSNERIRLLVHLMGRPLAVTVSADNIVEIG
jgi:transcription antitermination factor NusG